MLTVFCGDDVSSSRSSFLRLKTQYTEKGYEIKEIDAANIPTILTWVGESQGLFFEKQVFFTDHLDKHIIRKRGKSKGDSLSDFETKVKKIASDTQIELVCWEEKDARELKTAAYALIKESKLSESIFKLNEACYPKNLMQFYTLLQLVSRTQEDMFIFIMLQRHVRNLILAKEGKLGSLSPWQAKKIISQASYWNLEGLVDFYSGLARIEISIKTGTNSYGVIKSLEILACHYL